MKKNANSSNEVIRIEAYLLSENAGHPHGMEAVFWAEGEAIVQRRRTPQAAPKTTAGKKAPANKKTATGIAPAKTSAVSKKSGTALPVPSKAPAANKPVQAKASATKKPAPKPALAAPKRKGTKGPGTLPS